MQVGLQEEAEFIFRSNIRISKCFFRSLRKIPGHFTFGSASLDLFANICKPFFGHLTEIDNFFKHR